MTHATQYDFLRAQVRDGDTLAPIAKGVYGAALALGAMGPYGHTGIIRRIAVEGVERVMVIEENPGGGRYTPLSHYKGVDLDIFRAPEGIDGRTASNHAVQILDGLSKVIRARFKLFRRVRAITAEAKWSGMFLSAFPIVALLMIIVIKPDYYDAVRETAAFIPAALFVAVFLIINIIFMKVMTNIKV